jgi:hypothetical protein
MYNNWYLIYLLTAVGLSPGGSAHLHTNNTQNNTNNNETTLITTNFEECGPCPVFANFTLAFALQLRKKHGKNSVRVQYTYYQNTHTLQNLITHTIHTHITHHAPQIQTSHTPHKHTSHAQTTHAHHTPHTHTHTHTTNHTHTHAHTHTHYKTI